MLALSYQCQALELKAIQKLNQLKGEESLFNLQARAKDSRAYRKFSILVIVYTKLSFQNKGTICFFNYLVFSAVYPYNKLTVHGGLKI